MFTKEDIIARLKNGDSIDTIADEISDTLNAAQEEYAIQKEEKAKDAAVKEAKLCAAEAIIDDLCDFACASGDDEAVELFNSFEPQYMVEALDSTLLMLKDLMKLEETLFPKEEKDLDAKGTKNLFNKLFS